MANSKLMKWIEDHQINFEYEILPSFVQAVLDKYEKTTFDDYTGSTYIVRRLPERVTDCILGEPLGLVQVGNDKVLAKREDGTTMSALDYELAQLIIATADDEDFAINFASVERIDGDTVYIGIDISTDVRPPKETGKNYIIRVGNEGYFTGAEMDGTYIVSIYDTDDDAQSLLPIIRQILPTDDDYQCEIDEILENATFLSTFYYVENQLVSRQEFKYATQEGFRHWHEYFHVLSHDELDIDFENINPRTLNTRLRKITGEENYGTSMGANPLAALSGAPTPEDDEFYDEEDY